MSTAPAALDLLISTPNARARVGAHRDKFLLNPAATGARHLRLFRFLGRLIGVALRTSVLLSLDLSATVWKQLVRERCTLADLERDYAPLVDGLLRPLRAMGNAADDKAAAETAFRARFPDGSLTFAATDSDACLKSSGVRSGVYSIVFSIPISVASLISTPM
jgi:hypothetical protein